jgi:hypothetical protein
MSAVVLVKQGKSIVTTTSDETLYVLKAEESPAIADSTYVVAEDLQKSCGALHTWLWIPRRHPTARGDVYLLQHVESCLFAYADHCRYGTMYLVQDEDEASMFNLIRRGNTVEAQALPPVDTSASTRAALAMGVFQDSAGRCSVALHLRKASTFAITAVWHEFPAETATAPSVISAFAADSESEAHTSRSSTPTSAPASSPDFETSTETDAAEVSDVNDASDQDASADMANALPWHPLERLKKQHLQDAMETGVPVKFVRGSKDLLDGPHRCPIFSCKFTATSWTALEGHLSSHHMVEGLQPLSRRSLANPTAGATTEQLFFDRARDRLTYAATQWPATCPIAHCGKKSADWGCLRQHLRRHGFRSVCLNQHGSRPQCTPPTKRDEPYVLSNHPNLLVRGQRAPPLTRSATENMSDAAELQFAADMRLKERELELGADVQAIRLNAFCGGFVVPNTYQRKSLSKRNNRCFSSEDLAPWTVIAVERDAIFRSLRHNHCQQAEHANCLLTWVTVGIPEDRVTVQIIVAGPKGIPAATECRLLDPTISPPPPRLQSTRRLAVDVTFPETEDAVDTEWPWGEPYYYGVGPRHKLPREQHSSSPTHSQSTGTRIGPTVYYPDCALRVQNCAALGGDQKEVVAEAPIQQATCFAYCGPRCDPDLDDDTTMVQSDSTAYRGGNIIRYVNHYFGFSDAGNVVFRTAKLLTRSSVSSGSTREVELTFLITTRNIAPRELLLAQSYGPAYDIHLQRIALTKGLYLSAVEARRLLEIGLLPQYAPHHLNSLAVGDVVGLRETNGKVKLHIIDEVVSQSGALVLQALTELKFPQYAVPDDDAPTVTVLASHVIPFVNQWDFSLDRDHRKLTMKTPTLQMKLDRLSKC